VVIIISIVNINSYNKRAKKRFTLLTADTQSAMLLLHHSALVLLIKQIYKNYILIIILKNKCFTLV
jgi:hypothetical protein